MKDVGGEGGSEGREGGREGVWGVGEVEREEEGKKRNAFFHISFPDHKW